MRGVFDHHETVSVARWRWSASMSAGCPAKCTGMIARVRGVIAASTAARIEVERVEVDVGEHRNRVRFHDRGGGGEERVRRHDDLVFGLDARREQRDSQRDRAVDDRDAVPAAVHRREAPLELLDLVAVEPSPLAAAQRPQQALLLRLAEDRPGGNGRVRTGGPPKSASKMCPCRGTESASLRRYPQLPVPM